MRRKQPEADLQRAICQHLDARGAPGLVWWHCPNGGARSKAEASIMAGLGVKRGVSDLHFFRRGVFGVLELKALGQKPTDDQNLFMQSIRDTGGWAEWTNNLDTAIAILERRGLLRGVSQNNRPSLPLATASRV